ncbi:MAG TPA: HAMP domain-containing protein, partial [Thermoanaerobaculia bacterium]|nr:HAMP domain-containing protein [Thermoanaerobaculia bacterium]
MKVASKIATSSVLLMGLLLFALGYSLYTVKESERTARNLVRNKLDAARLTADSLSLVGQADDLAQRLLKVWPLLPDNLPNLVEELRTLNDGFRANLDKLRSLSLAATEDDQIKDLYILWRKHLQVLAPILETPPATPLGEAGLLSRELPESFQLLKSQLARLQTTLTQESNEDVRASTVTSSRARRVVILVTALALALSIYLMNFTIRSINAPLKRLITANDAVAQGNFDVRLDASTGDEFSRLAASFNSMVEHLSELDRMKRDFVAHVSHELRNPLVVLQETNQLLIDELAGPLTEKQRRMLALNIESGRRLSAMIS